MRRLSIPVLFVFGLCLAACGGSDASERIHGRWSWEAENAYETLESDGTWTAESGPSGDPFDWGTYTFEDDVLTFVNADDSYCATGSAVWEVTISEDGNERHDTTVSESCRAYSVRGQDRVLVRYKP